jgi:small subunit ribosomal protein S16
MVVIRLSRGGAKKAPFYNIVVKDKRSRRDGRFIERVGYFNPIARGQETRLEMNQDRIDHWIKQGAQLSDRVANLLKAFINQDESVIKSAPSAKDQKIAQQKIADESAKKKLAEAKKAEAAEAKVKAAEEAEKAKAAEAEAKAAEEAEKAKAAEAKVKAAEEAEKAKAAEAEAKPAETEAKPAEEKKPDNNDAEEKPSE